jgi:hypothetical protein
LQLSGIILDRIRKAPAKKTEGAKPLMLIAHILGFGASIIVKNTLDRIEMLDLKIHLKKLRIG